MNGEPAPQTQQYSAPTQPVQSAQPSGCAFFFTSLIKDTVRWFFRGIGSCASIVLGYFLLLTAIVVSLVAVSGGGGVSQDSEFSGQQVYRDYGGSEKIALIELNGLILEKEEPAGLYGTSSSITPEKVEDALKRVRQDDSVKGVVFFISSPGGSPVASDMIFEILTDFKKDTKIPMTFLMGDVAASGGYYISAAADTIFAHPSTITGSIGVIMETYNLAGLYEKVGVKKVTIKAGKYKDILSDSREMTEEESKILDQLIQDAYQMFLQRVSEGRGLPIDKVKEVAEGKVYSGISAKDAGLVDKLGTLDSALAFTAEKAGLKQYKVVKIRAGGIFDELFSGIDYALYNTGVKLGFADLESPIRDVMLEKNEIYEWRYEQPK